MCSCAHALAHSHQTPNTKNEHRYIRAAHAEKWPLDEYTRMYTRSARGKCPKRTHLRVFHALALGTMVFFDLM